MNEKHLKKAHEALATLKKRVENSSYGGFGTASFAGVYDKKATDVYFQHPCHGSLVNIDKDSVAVVSLIRLGGSTEKQVEIFYDWLFNESPWADIFVLKDAKEVIKLGGVICETNFPSNLVAGALFASRGPWEHPNTLAFFADLLAEDKKLNKNLALISSMWCRNRNARKGMEYVVGITNAGHWPLSGNQTEKYVSNFINNKPVKAKLRVKFCISAVYRSGTVQCVYPIWGVERQGDMVGRTYKEVLENSFKKDKKSIITHEDRFGEKYTYIGYAKRGDFVTAMAKALREVQKGFKIAV